MTYMEVKMVLAELELRPKDQEPPKAMHNFAGAAAAPAGAGAMPPAAGSAPDEPMLSPATPHDGAPPSAGGVSVTVDTVTRPGSVVSGKVTFSDQKTAEWYLDQYGRLGFAPTEKGYRPSQLDLVAFQTELQSQLARFGY
ncbi:MAG: hypothetical protein HYR88_12970, partial [Verrucomicrobia bacterium]|nr:hypothetical protein [Verrucomicrobiota bacterium]